MRLNLTRDGGVTPLSWVFAPEWLTFEEACKLSGFYPEIMEHIIEEGGVDLNDEGEIALDSLIEFREALVLVNEMMMEREGE
jgi:hypothetical protein